MSNSGRLSVGDTRINLLAYGLPTDGATDCMPALLAARSAQPNGKMTLPPGIFKFLSHPSDHGFAGEDGIDLTTGQLDIEGQGRGATILHLPNDSDTAAIVCGPDHGLSNLSIVGVAETNVGNVGAAPLRRGVVLRDRSWLRNVTVEAFGTNIVVDGNHQSLEDVKAHDAKHNIAWAQNLTGFATAIAPSFNHGNQTLAAVDLTGAGEASIYVAGDSKIDASDFLGVHVGFCPHGILLAAKTTQDMALGGGTTMYGFAFENCGTNFIEDLGFNTANRRMSKGLKWIFPKTGGIDPAFAPGGVGGLEMVKLGIVADWTIDGYVGDGFNTSFGTVAWGTPANACGFRFEQCNGLYFKQADTLWNQAQAQGKPMFRWEGAKIDWSDVYFTVLDGGYVASVLPNGSGAALTTGKLVSGVLPASPTATNGVKHYDGTGAAIGQVWIGPNDAGLVVPIIFEGRFTNPPTTDATIVAGSSLTADAASGGVKRRTSADQQEVGVAYAAPSGGVVFCSFRGPWTARF